MTFKNMADSKSTSMKIYENDKDVASNLCNFVISKANEAIESRGMFTVGLSGGSMSKFLCQGLPDRTTDWSKWRVFFCDERHVPFDDPECTYNIYKRDLMSKVPLSQDHIYPDNPSISVEDAATEYTQKLKAVFGDVDLPVFDLLLLGMGPDGHTCSLFPGHPLLDVPYIFGEQVKNKWVASISDSPKPPPQRITLTFPVLNNARCAVFASCGEGKASMVKEVLEGGADPPLPASRVRPNNGELVWFLDKPAARLLTSAGL